MALAETLENMPMFEGRRRIVEMSEGYLWTWVILTEGQRVRITYVNRFDLEEWCGTNLPSGTWDAVQPGVFRFTNLDAATRFCNTFASTLHSKPHIAFSPVTGLRELQEVPL